MGPTKTSDENRKKSQLEIPSQRFWVEKFERLLASKSSLRRIIVAYKKDGRIERKKGQSTEIYRKIENLS